MLRIYYANSLETLRDVLVEMVHREPLSDPFASEQILVQSPGMAQWLKLELAERMGIAANIEFPLPASFLWQVFVDVLDEVPERSVYNKAAMTWVLMRQLPELLEKAHFAVLRCYCSEDSDPLRLYQLCACIADLFDQYLVYRPDWIAAWEAGENSPAANTEHAWQPILWRRIVADVTERGLPHWHRANMYETFFQALTKADRLNSLPSRVFVFGISALPENYVEALAGLGEKVDVHLMIANPCRHYWGDIVDPKYLARLNREWLTKHQGEAQSYHHVGHPILASMGKLGRDYLHIVQQLEKPEVGLFSEPCYDNLLHAVQSDILDLQDSAAADTTSAFRYRPDDKSIQLHATHSPLREIEVLQDQLLAMFAEDPALKPRDIIVMMPDVASYAPYIDAVFGNAEPEHFLPYSISDRSADQEIPLINSFLQLLNLQKSRFTAPQIIELLELPATQRAYGISPESFEDIRHWVAESGISWGLDADMRAEVSDISFAENSWAFGLDRLFGGYALGDVDLWQDTAPYAGVSGLSSVALGQLAAFISDLKHYRQVFTGERSLAQWISEIQQLTQTAYQPDDHDHEALALINQALENLQTTFAEAAFEQPLAADILRAHLAESLSAQRASQRFLSGQINFCTLMPMRAIPFRVVCLVGMNDGAYPRSLPPLGFDLMANHPRKGDRSRRDDDRYLFLEALLSAKETLYLSYVGRSIADNTPRIPSVLVSELLEYCEQAYGIAEQGESLQALLQVDHPLTAYSERYFDGSDARLFSYNGRWLPTAQPLVADAKPTSEPLGDEPIMLDIESVVRFFRSPAKYYFEQHLQVYFPEQEEALPEEEPFAVSNLALFALRERLLDDALKGESAERISQQLRAEGILPVGPAGELVLTRELEQMAVLKDKMQAFLVGEPSKQAIDLRFECFGQNVQLQGWLRDIYATTRLEYRASKSRDHHRFGLWIRHLAMNAMGLERDSTYRGIDKCFAYQPVPPSEAYQTLAQLIEFMLRHRGKATSWQPKAAWPLLTGYQHDPEEAGKRGEKAFLEAQEYDPYLTRLAYRWEVIEPLMVEQTEALFGSLLRYRKEDEK
ncbi:exodeoxyribonuclease V subunit gamma [Neptunomonas sp. XY-337]|uniref:exodeoxyribonuclease V subunit gamma n=1 Tax=Neptunomonas sp. XY-337 TaxID=2561897 RepID=UPI0010A9F035|nr:exodeoxyribonuclease V subunit gamma [Neptunomonas sp. XY-337]